MSTRVHASILPFVPNRFSTSIAAVSMLNVALFGVKGFHAREKQKCPARAIVEGDLFLSARSSFSSLLSFFFSHPESSLKMKIFVRTGDVLGVEGGEREMKNMKKDKRKKKAGNPHSYPQLQRSREFQGQRLGRTRLGPQ